MFPSAQPTPRRRLALAALATLGALACDDHCIDDCPAPRALAACVGSASARTVDDVWAVAAAALGERVTVRGTLAEEAAVCTQLGCFDGCCNTCAARLTVAGATAALPLASSGRDLVCEGDEVRVCCPLRLGAEVVVQGRVVKDADTLAGPTYALAEVAPCAPE